MDDVPDDAEAKLPPLPIDTDHWRSRWLYLDNESGLHRVSSIEWDDTEMIAGTGLTVCGQRGRLTMPGILGRMYGERCPACCEALALPVGQGAPYNEDLPEP